MHTIELGTMARDTVSGWEGTVTARYEYLNGCERYEVGARDKDGKPESFVFDVQQLEVEASTGWMPAADVVTAEVVAAEQGNRYGRTGGPRDDRPVAR